MNSCGLAASLYCRNHYRTVALLVGNIPAAYSSWSGYPPSSSPSPPSHNLMFLLEGEGERYDGDEVVCVITFLHCSLIEYVECLLLVRCSIFEPRSPCHGAFVLLFVCRHVLHLCSRTIYSNELATIFSILSQARLRRSTRSSDYHVARPA